MAFNEKTTLEEVLELSVAEDVLSKYNVPCLGCPMAKIEASSLTIGQICASYGIDQEKLLADLNAIAMKPKIKK
ncbi:MAG: disulfide oxidoreductase [Candidatus Nealsonbacteria bacterium DGGOD1a]|jgi:hypothetical protein|nr:MAG: disulfide oxidoreductase [Candidatus Nealsonbacteria bacterium DGGOD1a]